jgi:hypothetical protein
MRLRKIAVLIGVLLCIVPPLNIVYLIVSMLKNDVVVSLSIESIE